MHDPEWTKNVRDFSPEELVQRIRDHVAKGLRCFALVDAVLLVRWIERELGSADRYVKAQRVPMHLTSTDSDAPSDPVYLEAPPYAYYDHVREVLRSIGDEDPWAH